MVNVSNQLTDFSALFPDVVNCMQTDNLELKKLVYLYLMNYAKSQPDMAIMAVNTFVKVCAARCTYEPPRGKTNNVVSDQVRHKPDCTVREKS